LVALPLGIWLARRQRDGRERERLLATLPLVATFFMTLPLRARPIGFFLQTHRWAMFLPAVIVLWTLCPVLRALEGLLGGFRKAGAGVLAACSVFFAWAACDVGLHDDCVPFQFARQAMLDPRAGLDRVIFNFHGRAASFVDVVAGPNDHIAIDGAFDTWSYPAYGAGLTRRVTFLHPDRPGWAVPDDADWVVVDRPWWPTFGHPDFTDLGHWDLLFHGKPLPEDRVVFKQLRQDPRFRLVYRLDWLEQAVFQRIH
jgi:hypothetical protein